MPAKPAPAGRIAFTSWENYDTPFIHTVLPDGTGLRRITTGHTPRWSPDGSTLAFIDDAPVPSLFVVRADGSGRRRLTFDSIAADPQWSPSGEEIAFVAIRPTGQPYVSYSPIMPVGPGFDGDINVVSTGDAVARSITAGPDIDYEPSWSPDGMHISFLSSRSGEAVFVINRDGTGARQVWDGPSGSYFTGSTWAPGPRIAVATGAGLWAVSADAPAERIGDGEEVWAPLWSRDGDALLVRAAPASSQDSGTIVATSVAGRTLFRRPGLTAAWSFDGQQLAFWDRGAMWRVYRDGGDPVRVVERRAWNNGVYDELAWSAPSRG